MKRRAGGTSLISLPATVILLGFVSLLNDASSEMITPLLPVFLTATLGAGPLVVGLVEGVAEATASVLKLVSGRMADSGWPHKGLVIGGYSVSNSARPLIGLALGWSWVLLLRFLDRLGKGLRTSPRDALIAAATDKRSRGRAFGFHRAMDNAGAMLGPLIAFALLQAGLGMRHVFLASLAPGSLVVVLLLFGLPTAPARPAAEPQVPWLRWSALDRRLRSLIVASGGLALATTPEVFLILWAEARGIKLAWVPLIWAAAHAVKALVATPAGSLSDRFGRLPVVVAGWSARVLLLALLATAGASPVAVWGLFLAYAGALAFTEGSERALVGDLAAPAQTATAFGLYHLVCGVLALPGAVLFGFLWQVLGSRAAFLAAAGLTAVAALSLAQAARSSTRA